VGENWSDPEFNRPTTALRRALEILASVEKQFAIDPERIDVVGQSMGGLGVWSLLQTHSEKWAAAVVLAAYDNFTAPMSISRIPL
jgi:predicted peptidase